MNFLLRFVLSCLQLLQVISDLLRRLFYDGGKRKQSLPKIKNPLLKISATALARKIRKKEITSEELLREYIERIEEVNPILNAVVEHRFREALEDAKQIDSFLRESSLEEEDLELKLPLLGIPVTIKESLAVKGLSYTGCSKTREGIKAEVDSEVVRLLKEAGAIIVLVSNTPEYCTSVETANKIIGITCNPYNTLYSSGGSSGGEGALIGSGASLIGIGSDIAGSIRIPAAFNGIFGHKPTSGVVSLKGHFPYRPDKSFTDYLVVGPLTRYAVDLNLVLKVITGQNVDRLKLDAKVDLDDSINVYFMDECAGVFGVQKVDDAIKIAIRRSVKHLHEKRRCKVGNHKFHGLDLSLEIFCALIFKCEHPLNVLADSEMKYNYFLELFKSLLGKSIFPIQTLLFFILIKVNFFMTLKDRRFYHERARKLRDIFTNILGTNGVFIYPSFPTGAFRHGGFLVGSGSSSYPAVFNVLGLPATCVSAGLNAQGMPIGIQIIAGPNHDRLGLKVAEELEVLFGGWREPKARNYD